MNAEESTLWKQLQTQQLVVGDAPDTAEILPTPWYMRAMLGFLGWIGAILILGVLYLGLHDLLDSNNGRFTIGIIMGAVALQLYRGNEDQDLRMQFALALGLCAQLLLIWAFSELFDNQPVGSALAIMVFEIILWAVIDNSTVRFGTTAAAVAALLFVISHYGFNVVIPSLLMLGTCSLWAKELSWIRYRNRLLPAAWAITLLALLMLGKNDFNSWLALFPRNHSSVHPLLLTLQGLLTISAVIISLRQLLAEQQQPRLGVWSLLSMLLLSLLCFSIPGVGFSVLLVLLGFARGNYLLVGLSLAALLFHLSRYYYLLDVSLLHKSLFLIGSGAAILLLRKVFLNHSNKEQAET